MAFGRGLPDNRVMIADIVRRASLKTKVTVFTLGIFVLGIWTLSFYASRVLHDDMERELGAQQFSTVSFVARAINESLEERLLAVESVAAKLAPATLAKDAALQSFLDQQPVLQMLFSGGVFVTRLDGTAVAELPRAMGRIGVNFLDWETVAIALKEGRSLIGPPLSSAKLPTPVFGVVAPIRNVFGDVIGALVGVVSLQNAEFLDHLTQSRYGKKGGFFLVARKERLIVTASNKERVMRPLAPPGRVPAIDRFVDGYEGTQIYVNPFGVEVIASVRRLTVVDWGISVSIPTEEAFAPIRDMQLRLLIATVFLTLLAGVLTWWMLKRQFSPLLSTARMLAHLSESKQPPQALPIVSEDEIGELIAGFNTLLADLAERKSALTASEKRLFTILESVDSLIYLKDCEGRYLFANRRVRECFGASMEEIVGQSDERFFDAETLARLRENDASVLREGSTLRSEEALRNRAGESATYLTVKLPLRNDAGEIYALCGISTDITERKQLEDQVRQLAFYDSLTSLPNRRLLEDRLRHAVAGCRRSGTLGALMFVDLDNFKPLNDRYGHEFGDLLLIEVAARLRAGVREIDTVARFGGDEFVIMLGELAADPAAAAAQAGSVAEKLRDALCAPYLLARAGSDEVVEHRCSASIGLALFDGREIDQEGVLKRADKAMYQAKEFGRNLVCFAAGTASATASPDEAPGKLVQLVWHASYASGNAVIDAQHRGLIDDANQLLAAIISGQAREDVAGLIDRLLADVAVHFADEEAIIAAAGFPELAAHASLHRELQEGADRLVEHFRSGELGVGELFQFLAHEVIARHMLKADREFFDFLAGRR